MSTETVELEVPDRALRTAESDLHEAFWHGKNELRYNEKDYARGTVEAIATPVVVAELRRLATQWDNLRCTSMDVIEALHQRADDLEAGQ